MKVSKLYMIPAIVAACMAAAGCSVGKDPENPASSEDGDVTLRFKVSSALNSTGYDLSRADNEDHEEVGSSITTIEDVVNVKDFAFFIFAGDDGSAPMISAVTDISASTDPNTSISGGLGVYDVSVVIKEEVIEKYLGRELSPNLTTPINLRLVVLANTTTDRAATGNFSTLPMTTIGSATETQSPTTLSGFMEEAGKLTYDISTVFYDQEQEAGGIKGVIPMFGIRAFTVPEKVIYQSRPDDRIYLGEINLLRAVAKVRVVDAIPKPDGVYPRISNIRFIYASPLGSVLPKNAVNYVDGQQVHEVNIPSQNYEQNFGIDFISNPEGHDGSGGDEYANLPELLVYVPEQKIMTGSVPVLSITVRRSETGQPQVFQVPMSGYKGVTFPWTGSQGYIIRNHIYEFRITGVENSSTLLNVSVKDWKKVNFEDDY